MDNYYFFKQSLKVSKNKEIEVNASKQEVNAL